MNLNQDIKTPNFNEKILEIIDIQNGENIKFLENIINPDIGEFIIIASFASKKQVLFAAQKMIRAAKELKIESVYDTFKRKMDTEWVCVKFNNTIVHLFQEEVRDYYNIDNFYLDNDNFYEEKIENLDSLINDELEE